MAIDPLTGNLWYGSDQGNNVVELSLTTHSVLRQVNLALQGVDNNEISGLAFDATGQPAGWPPPRAWCTRSIPTSTRPRRLPRSPR